MKVNFALKELLIIFLTANLIIIQGCGKDHSATNCRHSPLVLGDSVCNMGRTRLWHGFSSSYALNGNLVSSSPLADTSFAINVISNTVIQIGSQKYSSSNSTDSLIEFSSSLTATDCRPGYTIDYYPLNDSVVIDYYCDLTYSGYTFFSQ